MQQTSTGVLGRRAAVVAASIVVALAAYWATERIVDVGWLDATNAWDRALTWVQLVVGPTVLVCGAAIWWMRPTNRCGQVLVLLALDYVLWAGSTATTGDLPRAALLFAVLLRSLLYWVVLAWPVGRLVRSDRRFLVLFTVTLATCWLAPEWRGAPDYLGRLVVMPVGALVTLGIALIRFRRLPPAARRLASWSFGAALVATLPDLGLLVGSELLGTVLEDGDGRTAFGFVHGATDIARFGVAAILFLAAATAARRFARRAGRTHVVELGAAPPDALQTRLREALGARDLRIAYRRGDRWLSPQGEDVELGGRGRTVTTIERGGVPVAAVELDAAFDDRPTAVEAAVAAAAVRIEHERLEATARQRLGEVERTRLAILDVEDQARVQLERDLHDGAQQQLVGLALQARLAAGANGADPTAQAEAAQAVAAGVCAVRDEIGRLADGRLPAILAERGLGAALLTLTASTSLDVDVDIRLPGEVPADVAATAWFVVNEAVANAVRHARAGAVHVIGEASRSSVVVAVSDDGVGGASEALGTGLRLLRDRVERNGGSFTVDSPPDGGTTIRAELPMGPPS